MASWILVLFSIFLGTLLFFTTVLWVLIPEWFGVYGYKRKTAIGKRYIRLLILFPFMAAGSLYFSWFNGPDTVVRYIVLVPTIYIIILWFYRLDKYKRCFITKQGNLDYHLDKLNQQMKSYDSLIKNEDEIVFSFHCLAPNKSLIKKTFLSGNQYIRSYLSGGYLVNKSWFVEVYSNVMTSSDEKTIQKILSDAIENVWDAGGELAGWRLISQQRTENQIELDK